MSNLTPKSIVDKNGKATTVHINPDDKGSIAKDRLDALDAKRKAKDDEPYTPAKFGKLSDRLQDRQQSYTPQEFVEGRPDYEFNPPELAELGFEGFRFTTEYSGGRVSSAFVILTEPRPEEDKDYIDRFKHAVQMSYSPDDDPYVITEIDADELPGHTKESLTDAINTHGMDGAWMSLNTFEEAIEFYGGPDKDGHLRR